MSPFKYQPVQLAIVTIASSIALAAIPTFGYTQVTWNETPTTTPGSKPAPLRLNMQSAVETAVKRSKTLKISAETVNKSHGRVLEQRAGYKPSLNSQTTITHLDQGSSINIGGQDITIVKQDQTQLGVSGNLPVDFTGLIRAAVQQAEFVEIATRLDYNRTRNQTVLDVKNAYYDVLRAKAFVKVTKDALDNANERLTTAEATLKAGTGTRFDVLRAQTDVANAQQNLLVAENRVNLTNAALANVLNIDQNTPIETADEAADGKADPDFNMAITEAYKLRPEVLQADANVAAAERGIRIAERSALPSIGLNAGFQYTPDASGFAPKTKSWSVAGTITVPLFDQGLARTRTEQAKSDVNSSKISKQVTLDGIALEVRQNYLSLTEARDRLRVSSAALDQAAEQYRLAQVRYKAGVTSTPGGSPLLEISDAQAALTQAQTNVVNARYDLANAQARLDRAIGRYAYGQGGAGYPSTDIKGLKK